MPQPLSRVAPNCGLVIGGAGEPILHHRPQLALLVAEAIASWSHVESFMLSMFITLMGGQEDNAATIYMALETQNAKNSAIKAIADKQLDEATRNLLNAILSIVKSGQKQRDRVAHWIYGYSPNLPEALLLANPRDMARAGTEPSEIINCIHVYNETDFKNIIELNHRLCGFGLEFNFILRKHPANAGNLLFDRLCNQPEIRERLDRQASRD